MQKIVARGNFRWVILAMLFLATVLNYVDRQALSILASYVQRDLDISDTSYAHIVQAFLIAYTFAYLIAGWLTDRLGVKLALALFLGWWSLANMATGFVRSAFELGFVRAMLGVGEPGVYTAGPKAVQAHFPPEERGLAFGTFTAGAMVGATLAPPLIGGIALTMGWRAAFVVSGAAGFLWLIAWLFLYREARDENAVVTPRERVRWRTIAQDKRVWGLAASRMLSDPVWYFYLFWFPKYLTDARGLDLLAVAKLAWIVYLAADLGSIGGGWFSGQLVRRGMAAPRARLVTMGMAACLSPIGALIAFQPGIEATLALGAVVAFAHLVLQINISTLIIDIYPKAMVATVFGVIAAGSGLGGILSTQIVGQFASAGGYGSIFLMMATLHPLSCAVAWVATRRDRSIKG